MGCATGRELEAARWREIEAARCEAEKERAVSRERELAAIQVARERELAAKDREHALQSALLVAAADKAAGVVLAERTLAARDITAVKTAAAERELRFSAEKAAFEQRLLQYSHGTRASGASLPPPLATAQFVAPPPLPPPPALQQRTLAPALPQPTVLP